MELSEKIYLLLDCNSGGLNIQNTGEDKHLCLLVPPFMSVVEYFDRLCNWLRPAQCPVIQLEDGGIGLYEYLTDKPDIALYKGECYVEVWISEARWCDVYQRHFEPLPEAAPTFN